MSTRARILPAEAFEMCEACGKERMHHYEGKHCYDPERKKMKYVFEMQSDEYGADEFGPYDTEQEAEAAIERVKAKAATLDDGIIRKFSNIYTED